MKLSKRDAKLLLMLAGLLIFLLSYLLVYNRFIEKQAEISAKIAELQPQLQTLETYQGRLSQYKMSIDESRDILQKELQRYPANIRAEDLILYAKELESRIGIDATGLVFADPVLVNEFSGIALKDGKEVKETMSGYRTEMNLSGSMTYSQLKNLLNYIYSAQDYTSVGSVSVSYDAELARMTGTVEISKFYLTYPDVESVAATMPTVPQGNLNLFGSVG